MAAVALVTTSHSPLMNQPADEVAAVEAAFQGVRGFIRDFAPDLVVVFAPDHYNGADAAVLHRSCAVSITTAWRGH